MGHGDVGGWGFYKSELGGVQWGMVMWVRGASTRVSWGGVQWGLVM